MMTLWMFTITGKTAINLKKFSKSIDKHFFVWYTMSKFIKGYDEEGRVKESTESRVWCEPMTKLLKTHHFRAGCSKEII